MLRRNYRDEPVRARTAIALGMALVAAAALRLAWVGDMEYKGDEAYMFHRTQAVGVSEPWPWLGERSGVGLRNPGLSVWAFVAPARVLGLHDPTAVDRIVEVANIAALVLLLVFALRWVPESEREPWLWATVLMALNPTAIVLSRKIWAQSLLPLFSSLVFMAWWFRRRWWAAFLWGLCGALLGQVHMSGFFFAAGLALWTALFDRRSVRWTPWLAGTLLGSVTLGPWLYWALGHPEASHRSVANVLGLDFWRFWGERPLALDLGVSVGPHFKSFLASPQVGGVSTHGVALCYALILASAVVIIVGAAGALWQRRRHWLRLLIGRSSPTAFGLSAVLVGFGGLLTLSAVVIYRHYLLVAFVLPFLWIACLALLRPRAGRRALTVLCVAEAVLAAQFLAYVHVHHGAPRGDYGVSYSAQPTTRATR